MQLELFENKPAVIHYLDRDGALHSGHLARRIKRGKRKGTFIVSDSSGKKIVPHKIRNIE